LLFSVCDENDNLLKPEIAEKLFFLPAETNTKHKPCPFNEHIEADVRSRTGKMLQEAEINNHSYFNEELDKLDRWAEDLKNGLELEIKKLDKDIRELDRQSKQMVALSEKLEFQRQKAAQEKRRTAKRHELYTAQDEIDKKRDTLIKQIEKQLQSTRHEVTEIFQVSWSIH